MCITMMPHSQRPLLIRKWYQFSRNSSGQMFNCITPRCLSNLLRRGAAFSNASGLSIFSSSKPLDAGSSIHLDDSDEENGCINVIPGSHKQGPLQHVGSYYLSPEEYPIDSGISCPAKAGDVLIFNYLTVHGSKPNRSERTRRNVLFQYRDPSDLPTKDVHVNWGQGLMVCGENPEFRAYRANHSLVSN